MKNTIITLTLVFTFFFISCEDIIEKNLKKESIELLSPLDGDTIYSSTIKFWWNIIEAKDVKYRIQIVKNTFSAPTQLVLDSVISDNIFLYNLPNGNYEWRIRAENNSSETVYKMRSLFIEANADLSDETQTLTSPVNNLNSNVLHQKFKWSKNLNATSYDFELLDNAGDTYAYENTTEDTISISLTEGKYTWRVKAKNETSETSFSTYRSLLIDITPPAKPLLVGPGNNSSQGGTTISFSWNQGSSLSEVVDTLFIYSDSLITLYDALYTTDPNIDYNFSSLGTYFWRVKSGDAAGNSSAFSNTRKFTIN